MCYSLCSPTILSWLFFYLVDVLVFLSVDFSIYEIWQVLITWFDEDLWDFSEFTYMMCYSPCFFYCFFIIIHLFDWYSSFVITWLFIYEVFESSHHLIWRSMRLCEFTYMMYYSFVLLLLSSWLFIVLISILISICLMVKSLKFYKISSFDL